MLYLAFVSYIHPVIRTLEVSYAKESELTCQMGIDKKQRGTRNFQTDAQTPFVSYPTAYKPSSYS
jgi:hypothetical protein